MYKHTMDTWTAYAYVCNDCDASIQITTRQNLEDYRGWCACGSPNVTLIGWADATVKTSHNDVTNLTLPKVVKINTNPYN
jgi:hypothetical protein